MLLKDKCTLLFNFNHILSTIFKVEMFNRIIDKMVK